MALGQAVAVQSLRHRLLQPEQAQLVGHGRLAAAQLFRRLLLAEAVAAEQAGDGGRLLHIIQIPALEVLDQGQQGGVLLIHPGQQTGHLPQPGDPRRPPAALAGHQLVGCALLPDGERLQNAVGGDTGRQLLQTLRVEPAAGLLGVGTDIVDGYVIYNYNKDKAELTEVLTKTGRATRITSKNLNCLTCKGISAYKDDEYILALCNYYEKLSNEENEKDENNKERY